MSEIDYDAYMGDVWTAVAAYGPEGTPDVRQAYAPMLMALADAGASVQVTTRFLEKQIRVSMAQYHVLLDTMTLVSDGIGAMVDLSDGKGNDPVTLGHTLVKQKAGLAEIQHACAQLAPFAGIGETWDAAAVERERDEAVAERDGFLAEIEAIADSALAE